MNKVLLLSMPFGSLNRPALGISMLKARLLELGIDCDIKYLTYSFAELIGFEEYQWITSELPYTAFAGDWTFTEELYGSNKENDQNYIREILRDIWQFNDINVNRLLRVRSLTTYFIKYCIEVIPWEDYAVVGFTSTFEQNISSLALAKAVKQDNPQISIVFGGANWEAEMGHEFHKQYKFVDYVCSGEAENSFPALVEHLLARRESHQCMAGIKGITYRKDGLSISTGDAQVIHDLDTLPVPDFSDYFQNLSQSTVAASVIPVLLFETSRGCWWGQKLQCTFCGLNGRNITFRSKSGSRALDELFYLADRWQIELVEVVDNMMDMRYFHDFLPALANSERSLSLFYEVKANLSRNQVKILRDAMVDRIQPGIESLNNHVLHLMRKGTTALINIQLLKWCKEYNIRADWNILYGFPGETRDDYETMLSLLQSIRFLCSAPTCGPVRLDRFSPFFNNAEEFGLIKIRPIKSYQYIYPFDAATLSKIAYCFDFEYLPELDPTGAAAQLISYVENWKSNPEKGTLTSISQLDGRLTLIDTRSDAIEPEYTLPEIESSIYKFCDSRRTTSSIRQYLSLKYSQANIESHRLTKYLDSLVAHKLMVTDEKYYLSLAIPTNSLTDEIL